MCLSFVAQYTASINSGIHDVFCISKPPVLITAPAINETLSRFPGRLDRVLTLLRGIVGPDCVIAWKFTTPGERYLQLLLETLNQAAIRVVQQHASRTVTSSLTCSM